MAYEVSVFLENKLGHLKQVTSVLKEKGINIRTMNLAHTANSWGYLIQSYPILKPPVRN